MRTPPVRRGEVAALTAIAAGVLGLGVWHLAGPEERIAFLFYDDAYYYFQVARNLAAGLGSTFDGIHPSNGYHPLWCALLIPVFAIAADPSRAVAVIAAIWFLLAAAVPVVLWWALRPRTGAGGSVLAAALFGLAPWVALGLARPNGLETPLYALLCALALGAYQRTFEGRDAAGRLPGRPAIAGLGLLLGIVVLARLDGGALAVAVALGVFWIFGREAGWRVAMRRVLLLTAAAVAVAGPSLVWNVREFGSPVPVSGRVVALEAAHERASLGGAASPSFWKRRARHAVVGIPKTVARAAVEGVAIVGTAVRRSDVAGPALAFGVLGIGGIGLALRRRKGRLACDAVAVAFLFAAIHTAAYAAWLWTPGEAQYRLYYFMPEVLAACAGLGAAAGPAFDALVRSRTPRAIVAAGLLSLLGVHLIGEAREAADRVAARPGRVADRFIYGWVRSHLPDGAVLGARDAGKLGFFSGRRVVNLDGLVNDSEFFEALRDDRVDGWIADSPIEFLLFDRPWLGGFDPARPEVKPPKPGGLAATLWRLHARPDVNLREVACDEGDWVVLAVDRTAVVRLFLGGGGDGDDRARRDPPPALARRLPPDDPGAPRGAVGTMRRDPSSGSRTRSKRVEPGMSRCRGGAEMLPISQ